MPPPPKRGQVRSGVGVLAELRTTQYRHLVSEEMEFLPALFLLRLPWGMGPSAMWEVEEAKTSVQALRLQTQAARQRSAGTEQTQVQDGLRLQSELSTRLG